MVELKYDEEKNNLKLPKNIRQVGKPGEKIKIYVEDYVITYINQIARESADQQRLAVLLGKIGKNNDDTVAFIDGAVEARGVVVQEDQVTFTSEIWTQIYDEIGQYFHNTEVVGWFLTRPGKSLGINDKITKIHVDNFPGVDKALFIIDPLDHEEAFYIYNQGELVRQDGYYIYYERNEDMQNYMVDHKGQESTEQQTANVFLKKKEEILERRQAQKKKDARSSLFSKKIQSDSKKAESKKTESLQDSKNDKKGGFSGDLYKGMKRASSLVVTFAILFALIFGFSQLNRRKTQEVSNSGDSSVVPVDVAQGDLQSQEESSENMDDSVNNVDSAEVTDMGDVSESVDLAEENNNENIDVAQGQTQADGDPENTDDYSSSDSNINSDLQSEESEVAVQNVIRQYEVREGDTLAGISEKFFNDYKYIEIIQEMNQIEDPNMIFPGMMLNLPEK